MAIKRGISHNVATMDRRFIVTGIVATSATALGSCSPSSNRAASVVTENGTTGIPTRGGRLRVSFDQPARRLNPIKHVLTSEFLMGGLIFSGLTRLGYNMLPEPD